MTDENNNVNVQQVGSEPLTVVDFSLEGGNPAAGLPNILVPDLEAEIKVEIRQTDGKYEYRVSGDHDGFPAYFLYVNKVLVHCYDPLKVGNSPWALGGGLDQSFNYSQWQDVETPRACPSPISLALNYAESGRNGFVTLTGANFTSNSVQQVTMNGESIGSLTADGDGTFKGVIDTSRLEEGVYTIEVVDAPRDLIIPNRVSALNVNLVISDDFPSYEKDGGNLPELEPEDESEKLYLPIVIGQ